MNDFFVICNKKIQSNFSKTPYMNMDGDKTFSEK